MNSWTLISFFSALFAQHLQVFIHPCLFYCYVTTGSIQYSFYQHLNKISSLPISFSSWNQCQMHFVIYFFYFVLVWAVINQMLGAFTFKTHYYLSICILWVAIHSPQLLLLLPLAPLQRLIQEKYSCVSFLRSKRQMYSLHLNLNFWVLTNNTMIMTIKWFKMAKNTVKQQCTSF